MKKPVADMEEFAKWLYSNVSEEQWNRWVMNFNEDFGLDVQDEN